MDARVNELTGSENKKLHPGAVSEVQVRTAVDGKAYDLAVANWRLSAEIDS